MFPLGSVYTPTATVYGVFNTVDSVGAPITLAGSPVIRIERNRAGTWTEAITTGITLRVDQLDTGRHEYDIDLDGLTSAAAAGDVYRVALDVGTVDGNSVVGLEVGHFFVEADGLTAAQKVDVNVEADTALTDYDAATGTEMATAQADLDIITGTAGAIIGTDVMTEAYAADGATMSVAQALYEIKALLSEFAVSGTTLTINGLDGTTAKKTYTLNSATDPASITGAP